MCEVISFRVIGLLLRATEIQLCFQCMMAYGDPMHGERVTCYCSNLDGEDVNGKLSAAV